MVAWPEPSAPPARHPASLVPFALDRRGDRPMHRQLYAQVRDAILSGRLAPGVRLPATRVLAEELGCSRNTVVNAFEQLHAEGYLEGRTGAGTFVSGVLPDHLLSPSETPRTKAGPQRPAARGLSRRGQDLAALARPSVPVARAFTPGLPDVAHFPFDVWGRLLGRIWRRPSADLLHPGSMAGYPPLRAAIARHLRSVRGLPCDAEQVLITAGAQQALDLVARVLIDPGDAVWLEEPGYAGLRNALAAAGARLVPVPVDAEGLVVTEGRRLAPDARLAAVTPSHQYPLGVTLSLSRRLALLDWASERDAWVLEDDYDSEYRYGGRPLASLQGLDASRADGGRVIYVGTFSKVLFPALRLGYLIAPPDLVTPLSQALRSLDDSASSIAQPALARFIDEGHFASHLRRMRRLYAARQDALLAAAERYFEGLLQLAPDAAGLHLVARLGPALRGRVSDREVEREASAAGIAVGALSTYYATAEAADRLSCQGLLLGYAALDEAEIDGNARRLAAVLRALARRP